MVYKRWKGKKVKLGDPNYDKARWWIEYRLKGRRIHKAVPEARTKAQAERAETSEREAIYNRRYNKGTDIGFTTYYKESYLPWLKQKKRTRVIDAESRAKKLKLFFGDRPLREISRQDVERFQTSLRGKKTKRLTLRKAPQLILRRADNLRKLIFARTENKGLTGEFLRRRNGKSLHLLVVGDLFASRR